MRDYEYKKLLVRCGLNVSVEKFISQCIICNMMSSTIIHCLSFVVALATLVASDPTTRIRLTNPNVTNLENEYFGDFEVEYKNEGTKSTKIYIKFAIKKELRPDVQIKFFAQWPDMEPVEYAIAICEGLDDPVIGQSIKKAGTPKGHFGTPCPFVEGDYEIVDWILPADNIPPGAPDGPFIGYTDIVEGDKPYYTRMAYDGEIFHVAPGFGR